jgi:hypothetical protein
LDKILRRLCWLLLLLLLLGLGLLLGQGLRRHPIRVWSGVGWCTDLSLRVGVPLHVSLCCIGWGLDWLLGVTSVRLGVPLGGVGWGGWVRSTVWSSPVARDGGGVGLGLPLVGVRVIWLCLWGCIATVPLLGHGKV